MQPRIQCLGLDGVWTWRLLGSNHRELARAWGSFATFEEAADDARAVRRAATTAPVEITLEFDTSWRWVLVVDGVPRAMSTAHYARRLECLRAVARFRDHAPHAAVDAAPLVRRGRRQRPALAGESLRDQTADVRVVIPADHPAESPRSRDESPRSRDERRPDLGHDR